MSRKVFWVLLSSVVAVMAATSGPEGNTDQLSNNLRGGLESTTTKGAQDATAVDVESGGEELLDDDETQRSQRRMQSGGDPEEQSIMLMSFMPFTSVRTDPIVSPTKLSDHVHTFYGAPLARPEITYNDLRTAPLGTANIEENQSLYWHNSFYQIDSNGIHHLVEMGFASAYYHFLPGQTTAFPPNFKMIAFAPDELIGKNTNCDDNAYAGPADGECLDPNYQDFFQQEAQEEVERMLIFPSCWNGMDRDSEDHRSHVVYPTTYKLDVQPSSCPPDFGVKLPIIRFIPRLLNYVPGNYILSDGTEHLHADFFNGWDPVVLQGILDGCIEMNHEDRWCEDRVTWRGKKTDFDSLEEEVAVLSGFLPNPPFDPTTITTEHIDGVRNLPRGEGTGTLIGGSATPGNPPPTSPPTPPTPTMPPPSPTPGGGDPGDEEPEDEEPEDEEPEDEEPEDEEPEEPDDEDPEDEDPEDELPEEPDDEEPEDGGGEEATSNCFAGSSLVMTKNGVVSMQELEIGDQVLVDEKGTFDTIYSFGHYHPEGSASFLEIEVVAANFKKQNGSSTKLLITSEHLVFLTDKSVIPAAAVKQGDQLIYTLNGLGQTFEPGMSFGIVKSIRKTASLGLYAPFTKLGTIVVNGVLTSCFVNLEEGSKSVSMAGLDKWSSLSYHTASYLAETPHRLWCTTVNPQSCSNETYNELGISMWSVAMLRLWKWVQVCSPSVKSIVLTAALIGLRVLCLIEDAIGGIGWMLIPLALFVFTAYRTVQSWHRLNLSKN